MSSHAQQNEAPNNGLEASNLQAQMTSFASYDDYFRNLL